LRAEKKQLSEGLELSGALEPGLVACPPLEAHDPAQRQIQDAIAGDAAATRALVAALNPVVRVRVARMLFRYRGKSLNRSLQQEVADLSQEVFLELFRDGARVLASWDPARGASLSTFVGLVANRTVIRVLKGVALNPWRDEPVEGEVLELQGGASADLEERIISRELAERLFNRLRAEVSPLAFRVFTLLFVQELGIEAAGKELGMSADALYAWRSRLNKTLRGLLEKEVA
jgi:RNA polymerase sigma factor (sigma-70 family)